MAIPRGLLVLGVVILLVGFLVGYLIGGAGDDGASPATTGTKQEESQGGGGQQGEQQQGPSRRVACRQALDLSQQIVGAQDQLLANRRELVEAVLSEDAGLIAELTTQAEELRGRITSLQNQLDRKIRRCL